MTRSSQGTDKIVAKAAKAIQAGEFRDAERLLRKILARDPHDLDGNFLMGNQLAMRRRYDEALPHLRRAIARKPNSVQVRNSLGNVLRALGNADAAETEYRAALEVDPHFAPARANLAYLLVKTGHWAAAAEQLEKIGAETARDPDLLFAAAETKKGLGERARAIALYRRVLELDPADQRGAVLRLADLGDAELPPRFPEPAMLRIYRHKAATWDADVRREGDSYFGPALLAKLLEEHLAANPALRALDLGCGTGACAAFLRPACTRLVGVDISPDMLSVAREKSRYDALFEAEAGAWLSACEERFDLVVAAGLFILFGDLLEIFRAVNRVMSPGATFAFTLYRGETAGVTLRHNYHFAHGRDYVDAVLVATGLACIAIDEVIHETDGGVAQPGLAVLARKLLPDQS